MKFRGEAKGTRYGSVERLPVNAHFFHPAAQGAGVEAENAGSATDALDPPAGLLQSFYNVSPFNIYKSFVGRVFWIFT